ncbi:MAG: nitroreductase family protein [Coriobacteriales bacterium]|jgi:nitroreductase|nr:nitroreductase family protein [Coriobacteriales bacterium]
MPVAEIIARRRSIRAYQPEAPVSDEQLHNLLEAALLAPSACNMRPCEFIVVRDRGKLDAIVQAHPYAGMLKTATLAIIVIGNTNIHNDISAGYLFQDCAAATENILLQAVSEGLGSCWCGVYPTEDKVAAISELFALPENLVPFNIIAIGVPAEADGSRGFYEEEKVRWE